MEYISGRDLYKMFEYGSAFVVQERKHLNDINVFPVADGDTGNNLAHTLKTIITKSNSEASFIKTLDSISESALIGARGNSGVIFAQFINGLRKGAPNKDEVSIEDFIVMASKGFEHTVASLSNPVEGTIISMMREFPNYIKESIKNGASSLATIFEETYKKSCVFLKKTTQLLDVLTTNNVVDSGALGFVLFVKGISSYYNNEEIELETYEDVELVDEHHFEGDVTFRYCTEGLVKAQNIDSASIKEALGKHGDSLIVAEGSSRFRVHIHTNDPIEVFEELKQYGQIESQKVDDMLLDMNLKNSDARRVIVTDSIADIDQTILQDNNVVVIPVNVDVDGINYLDKVTINSDRLFSEIDSLLEYPKTATPTIKYVSDLFNRLLLNFDEIIVVAVSEQLSATYRIINDEAKKIKNKHKNIYVIDSKNNSVTEGLLVQKAIELVKANVPTKEIVEILKDSANKTEILVCLNTFKYAMMSGRVPKVVGKIGMFLGMRPIMSLKEGKGTAFGFAFSQKSITKKIEKFVKEEMLSNEIERYGIVHCLNENLAKEYEARFTEIIGKKPEYITSISAATSIHSGLGSVAIGYIKK